MTCDIIIPIWNQLAFTKDCLDSVLLNTESGYGIIAIDNGSLDETRIYLEELERSSEVPFKLIRNADNLGFIKAVNQGLTASKAASACLLNNDTIVTKGWLRSMIAAAESSSDIGIVNPASNNLGQKPAAGEPIEVYAERLKTRISGTIEMAHAVGFCMLIKREVINRIGLFDEIYGMGNFEDTDYSKRAIKAGYKCVMDAGAYVYHRENTSFKKLKGSDEGFKRNREIYEFRWGKPKRIAYILDNCDSNIIKRIEADSLKLARDGNWVSYFSKGSSVKAPAHSNIAAFALPEKYFHINVLFRILKKKKKFNEIFVGNDKFSRVLESLGFIHGAKIKYY